MAHDGFYAGLSTRATVNEILNEALQVKAEIEVMQDDIEDKVGVISSAYASAEKTIYLPYQAPQITADTNGAVLDLDHENKYTMYRVVLNGAVPIVFINQLVPIGKWKSFELHLVQGTGGDTISSWPGNIVWNGGDDAPRLSTTIGDVDKVTFTTSDSGSSWQGQYARLFRTVSTSAPTGVAREGDEWIVVS